jgi:haloacetate dehalogenase
MSPVDELFPGFTAGFFDIGNVTLHARIGGRGPPLLLLHGYPETHAAWHKVAPDLARAFTVIVPDLRGYGHSGCVPDNVEHRAYSKRMMAADMVHLMRDLGHARFAVMGHNRGGRVAYRLALDWPQLVERLVILDIITTWDNWQPELLKTRQRLAHWAFLAQPAPIPESLIGADPIEWLEGRFRRGTLARSLEAIDPRVLDEYRMAYADPDHIHAACEDYRAGAGCDLTDDEADRTRGRRIECPTLTLWGTAGSLSDIADPLALWRPWCRSVVGRAVESGHYIPEENPAALLEAVLPFLKGSEEGP